MMTTPMTTGMTRITMTMKKATWMTTRNAPHPLTRALTQRGPEAAAVLVVLVVPAAEEEMAVAPTGVRVAALLLLVGRMAALLLFVGTARGGGVGQPRVKCLADGRC